MKFALAMNMPFFHVEGAQFSESHTVARLIGSPSGYVGPDKGILYVFAEDNAAAIVFYVCSFSLLTFGGKGGRLGLTGNG